MADVFQLLAESARRDLLESLREGERSVSELVESTRRSQSSVSKQLRILRESGLLALRSEGRKHLYSIQGQPLREVSEWLAQYERFWQEGLSRMDRALRREADALARRKP